ncbi:cytochrome c oxidase assembly protein [Salinicoccus albus]|uniref:cytochrome c oxidase assembly protein n=1 Tax=Salinicoccus albus TaxID=418756 RepID=UPI0003805370|nr:cytochrome c oxidase assembly protein [Salinicoccus albus]
MDHMTHAEFLPFEITVAILACVALILYPAAMHIANKKHRKWPASRCIFWFLGIILAAAALSGPLARLSHTDFTAHMMGHLLLGMLAPLLLVFSRPMTLMVRTLKVSTARKMSGCLNKKYVRFVTHPLVAATLNIGGLYLIYMTDLFTLMHTELWLFALVHIHVFLAGYLFTISILYIDITTHRYSFIYRAIVLILALGFHKILSKLIYAQPPMGIQKTDGEIGALLMYYGGDIVDIGLIIVLCCQWYRSTAPKKQDEAWS